MNDRSLHEDRKATGSGTARNPGWHDLPEAIKYGDVCYQAERYADALEAYSSALNAPRSHLTPELRARLHYRIAGCYTERNQYRLALEHLDSARKALPRHLDKVRLAKIYHRRGRIRQEMGQYRRAGRYLDWAKRMLSGTNEHEELAQIELRLGIVHSRTGRPGEARDAFLGALATFRRIDHRPGEAASLNNLGLFHKNQCEYREAVRYLNEAKELCERLGYRKRLVSNFLNLGIVYFKLGQWELCEEYLTLARGMVDEVGSRQLEVRVNLALGNLALRRRRFDEAAAVYGKAREMARAESYAREIVLADEFLGELALFRGELEAAGALLEPTLEAAREIAPGGDLVYEVLRRLAEVRLAEERYEESSTLAREAAAIASQVGDRYEEAVALRVVGLSALYLGDRSQGERLVEMSLDAMSRIGESYQKGLAHLGYGRFLAREAARAHDLTDFERAGTQLQRAYGAFLDLDLHPLAARSLYERALLECEFERFEEAAGFRTRARQTLSPGQDPVLQAELTALDARLEDAFAARWATGGDLLSSLREMKRLFQGASDTGAALDDLIRLAVSQSRSSRGCVARRTESGVRVVAVAGWKQGEAESLLGGMESTVETALRDNRPLWCSDTREGTRFAHLAEEPVPTRSLVILPFTPAGQEPGILYVDKTADNGSGGYDQGALQLLTILANLAALSIVERENVRLERENRQLKQQILGGSAARFVTTHPALQEHLRLVTKIADSPVSILVTGETGTGKSLLAQVIHESSNRAEKPFVQINCAALPEQLLESELFGHVKGAFTGASYNKVGLFQEAEGGTLFLDEVDKTSLAVQAKLLHVLDTKEVRAVGSVKPATVDTRVIVATNTDLRKRIADGEFLEDLYYRLNDFIVDVPPLRERTEDLPLLIDHFLKKFAEQYARPGARLSPEVRRALLEQPWPGNVRELEKTIRRLVVLSDDDLPIGLDLLPPDLQDRIPAGPAGQTTLREEIARTERRVIADALRQSKGNKSQAARDLKVSYPSLLKKVKEYGLEPAKE